MATICTDAADRRSDSALPGQLLVGLGVTAALVTVFYFFVDQPVMAFVSSYALDRYSLLKWLTRPPEAFVLSSPFVVLAGLIRWWFAPWTRAEKTAVAVAVSTLLAALAVLILKISFGRSADGFHPFSFGAAYWAFPSGHTACTLSVTVVAQAAYPSWRLACWSLAGMVATMLIVLNHHFVGDIIGGAFVGWAIGRTVARVFLFETSVAR